MLKPQESLYDVEHTFIDFRHLILGQKLKLIRLDEKNNNFVFDDYTLAEIINNITGNP